MSLVNTFIRLINQKQIHINKIQSELNKENINRQNLLEIVSASSINLKRFAENIKRSNRTISLLRSKIE